MRISDWSSDVCSSDLVDVDLQSGGSITQLPISGRLSLTGINFDSETVFAIYNGDTLTMTNSVVGGIRNFGGNAVMQGTNALTLGGGTDWAYGGVGSSEIGRASCRERVCPYV